jgi:spermidine dehydrogenase
VGISGAVLANLPSAHAQTPVSSDAYPPLRNGLRGQYPDAVAEFGRIRGGAYEKFAMPEQEGGEEYDLVVVGAGISGLSAAYFWRTALGNSQRVLVLDNHDDIGGHAKRNEFHYQGKTFIGYGGTQGIATPFPYSYTAKQLIKDLGVEIERNSEFVNRDLEAKYGLTAATFFDKEHFGADRVVVGNFRQPDFFERAPLSDAARKDLIRIHGKNPDYMAGMSQEQKRAALAKMSLRCFLRNSR